jgi:hypothetical protein
MFADPLSMTVNGSAFALTRIKDDGYSSEYRYQESTWHMTLVIRNTPAQTFKATGVKTSSHTLEVTVVNYGTRSDGGDTTRVCRLQFNNQQGDSLTQNVALAIGLCTLASASSGAVVSKMLGMES